MQVSVSLSQQVTTRDRKRWACEEEGEEDAHEEEQTRGLQSLVSSGKKKKFVEGRRIC